MIRVIDEDLTLIMGQDEKRKGNMGYVSKVEGEFKVYVKFTPKGAAFFYHEAELELIGARCPGHRLEYFHLMDMCKSKSCSCCDSIRVERKI